MNKLKEISKSIGIQRLIAFAALVVICLTFMVLTDKFRSGTTVLNILAASYYIAIMAIGVTFVIATGGIDLSIGTVAICSALIGGTMIKNGSPLWLGLIVVLLVGLVFGLINGILVSKIGLPPFIATLGMMMVSRGLGSIASKVQSVSFPSVKDGGWYKLIFRTNPTPHFDKGFPSGVILLIVLAVIAAIILNKTKIGRYILAIGSNKEATRLSGINVVKYETIAYVISGFMAALAGIAFAASYTTVLPNTGNGFELDAIAGVVIGGTSLSGGSGSISGTLIGVFIMSVLKIGFPYIGVQAHVQMFITGIVLIFAVYMDVLIRKKK